MIKLRVVLSFLCIHSFCFGMKKISPHGVKRKRFEQYSPIEHQKKLKKLFKKHRIDENDVLSIETNQHINFLLSDENMISAFLSLLIMPTFSIDKNQIFYQSRGETLALIDTGQKEAYIHTLLYENINKISMIELINKAIETSKEYHASELTIFVPSENEYIKSICKKLEFKLATVHKTKSHGSTTAFVKFFHNDSAHTLLSLRK